MDDAKVEGTENEQLIKEDFIYPNREVQLNGQGRMWGYLLSHSMVVMHPLCLLKHMLLVDLYFRKGDGHTNITI